MSKMFTETLLKIPLCDWPMFSSADFSLAGGKCTRVFDTGGFRYDFSGSQAG